MCILRIAARPKLAPDLETRNFASRTNGMSLSPLSIMERAAQRSMANAGLPSHKPVSIKNDDQPNPHHGQLSQTRAAVNSLQNELKYNKHCVTIIATPRAEAESL